MRPEHWQEIEALYHALASVEEELRASILSRARGANPDLCREVESLLAVAADADRILPDVPQVRQFLESRRGQLPSAMFQAEVLLAERFRIVRLIGVGGMGEVYEAEDVVLKESVALKTIRPGMIERKEMLSRFAHEVLAAKRVSHPNICRIHDLHRHLPQDPPGAKIVFLTMELLRGRTLAERLRGAGPMSLPEAEPIVQQIAGALTAAHRAGVIHRDLKPENIILTTGPEGRVRAVVTDFGLAGTPEKGQLTLPGGVIGTPAYMAPEQLLGGQVTSAADIYALGIVLYEMVTGSPPFTGPSPVAIAAQRLQAAPPSPRTYVPNLPAEWEHAILGCLEREPTNRFQSASDIWDVINGRSTPTPSLAEGSTHPRRFRTRTLAVTAAVFVIGVFSGVLVRSRLANITWRAPGEPQAVYIAILPFRALGQDIGPRSAAEGITEVLAGKLSSRHGVHLASRRAVDEVKSNDSLKISRALGVRFLVHGSVRNDKNGNLTVIATLEEAGKGRALWTEQFAGTSRDLLTVEDRISASLIHALHLPQTTEEANGGAAHPTENLEAYDLYLQGRAAFRQKSDVASGLAAVALFTRAIDKDPRFGLAYAGMADACIYVYDYKKDRIWLDKALYSAEQSKRLTSGIPESHIALGAVYRQLGRYPEAVGELERALALAPDSDSAALHLALAYKDKGDKEKSMQYYSVAINSNPYYWKNYNELGRAQLHFDEYGPAVGSFRKVIELAPDIATGYINLGTVYYHQGKCEQAIPQFQQAIKITPGYLAYADLGNCYYNLHRFEDAVQAGELAVKLGPNVEWIVGNLADAYRHSGRIQKAKDTYDRAIMLAYKDLETNPASAAVLARLALHYAKEGKKEEAILRITKARQLDGARGEIVFNQAIIEALFGDQSAALHHLREAAEHNYDIAQIESEPDLQSLRKLPEYRTAMQAAPVAAKP